MNRFKFEIVPYPSYRPILDSNDLHIYYINGQKVFEKLNLIQLKKFNSQFWLGCEMKVGSSMSTVSTHRHM